VEDKLKIIKAGNPTHRELGQGLNTLANVAFNQGEMVRAGQETVRLAITDMGPRFEEIQDELARIKKSVTCGRDETDRKIGRVCDWLERMDDQRRRETETSGVRVSFLVFTLLVILALEAAILVPSLM